MNRRQMLGMMGVLAAGTTMDALPAAALKHTKAGLRIFDVTAHGAAGDGRTLDTAAVNQAIAACHAGGGGVVYLPPGILRDVMIENVHATGSILTSSITGLPGFDVKDVTLSNIRIDSDEEGNTNWVAREIPEVPQSSPEARMFGRLPAYGFYCRHVKGLRMNHVEFKAAPGEERPALVCDGVKDLDIDGLRSASTAGTQPVIKLIQTRQALLNNCSAPAGTKTFLEAQGDKTEHIVLMNSDLTGAEQAAQTGAEVPKNAVLLSGNIGKA